MLSCLCPFPSNLTRPCSSDQQYIEHLESNRSAFPLLVDRPPQDPPSRHRPSLGLADPLAQPQLFPLSPSFWPLSPRPPPVMDATSSRAHPRHFKHALQATTTSFRTSPLSRISRHRQLGQWELERSTVNQAHPRAPLPAINPTKASHSAYPSPFCSFTSPQNALEHRSCLSLSSIERIPFLFSAPTKRSRGRSRPPSLPFSLYPLCDSRYH
jgi:hypothetical protein